MKKQYETPSAKKVEFDYTENVVASGEISKCPTCGQSEQVKDPYFWYKCWQNGITWW